jgi:hypothetical protein
MLDPIFSLPVLQVDERFEFNVGPIVRFHNKLPWLLNSNELVLQSLYKNTSIEMPYFTSFFL